MDNATTEDLLNDFREGPPVRQVAALRTLLARRKHLHDVASDARFKEGVRVLVEAISTAPTAHERLLALASLGRIASVLKKMRAGLVSDVRARLASPLDDVFILKDPDDRTYVAELCTEVQPSWLLGYAARTAIREESGEEARRAFLLGLMRVAPDLRSALDALQAALRDWTPATEFPGDSVGKRLRRVLFALNDILSKSTTAAGDAPGTGLLALIRASQERAGPPTTKEVALETADAIAATINAMIRVRFSLATEAATYDALRACRSWVSPRSWEQHTGSSREIAVLSDDISEALVILGRQGVIDRALAEHLSIAAGSRDRASRRLAQLARLPGIGPAVRTWWSTGESTEVMPAMAVTSEEDVLLSDILVDAQRFRIAEASSRREVLPELEVVNPQSARQIGRLMNYALSLCDGVESLAGRRHLRVRGQPGDEEAFSPLEHELVDGGSAGRRVRIVRPVVEQVRENGVAFVLRKGIAETTR